MYMSCCLIWHHHRLWRTSLPTTHIPIHIWHLFLDTWYLWTRYPCVSVDQIFMGVCRPDIYGYVVTRYPWVSVIFFLPEGKTVGNFLIAILVLVNLLKSLLTIHNPFWPLGKPVSNFLIAIPVLVIFVDVTFYDSWSFTTFTNYNPLQSNPLHLLFQATPPQDKEFNRE